MSEYHDVEEIGEKIVEMTERVKVAHSVLPGSQATWVLEVDEIRFKIVVTVDQRTPSPQPNAMGAAGHEGGRQRPLPASNEFDGWNERGALA